MHEFIHFVGILGSILMMLWMLQLIVSGFFALGDYIMLVVYFPTVFIEWWPQRSQKSLLQVSLESECGGTDF